MLQDLFDRLNAAVMDAHEKGKLAGEAKEHARQVTDDMQALAAAKIAEAEGAAKAASDAYSAALNTARELQQEFKNQTEGLLEMPSTDRVRVF